MLSGEIWLVLVTVAIAGALIMAWLWRTAEGRVVEMREENEALAAEGKQLGVVLAANRSREKQSPFGRIGKIDRRQYRFVVWLGEVVRRLGTHHQYRNL